MTKAADAQIGDKEECNICHVMLTCGETKASGNYPPKKQWQLNGESHYIFKPGQEMTCKGTKIEDPKNKHDTSTPRPGEVPYVPQVVASPEVLRRETGIEFSKVYNEFIPTAKEIANQLRFGMDTDADAHLLLTQRILRDYIVFYSAKNL